MSLQFESEFQDTDSTYSVVDIWAYPWLKNIPLQFESEFQESLRIYSVNYDAAKEAGYKLGF